MRAAKTRTEVRQDQIARQALEVISRHGFHELNVARVAREVGVVPSAIYRHYPSKDAVLDAVLDLVAERLLGNVAAVRAGAEDSLERLRRLLMRHAQMVRDEVPVPRIVFSEQIFTGAPRRRHRVHRMFEQYLAGIAGLIRDAQGEGRIRPGLDPDTLALMFLGLVQPAAILWVMSDGVFDVVRHAEDSWRLFASLIAVERPSRRAAGTKPKPGPKRKQARAGGGGRGTSTPPTDHRALTTAQRPTSNAERRGRRAGRR